MTIPQWNSDEVTSYDQLHQLRNVIDLRLHFSARRGHNPRTMLVTVDRWLAADIDSFPSLARSPDLLIAFDADPDAYWARNGYVIAEQGKPPDFVLEVASVSTGRIDAAEHRADYAALGVREYWRFDETGERHGARLAGDRLAAGGYISIPIEELVDGALHGHSEALNLDLRWNQGRLGWHDPAPTKHIAPFDDEHARAEAEEAARLEAVRWAEAAEARVRELEAELRRLRNG